MWKNNFDFLRFIAASTVIITHGFMLSEGNDNNDLLMSITKMQMNLGELGIAIFFVISGYLISKSYDRRSDICFFIKARILRLVPALTCVTIFAIILGAIITNVPLAVYFSDWQTINYLMNISALKLSYTLPGVFETNIYNNSVNRSLWSIRHEIVYYVMVAILGLMSQLKAKIIIPIFVFVTIISLIKAMMALYTLKCFLAGMILYLLRDKIPMSKNMAIVCTVLLLLSAQLGQLRNLIPILGSYLVIYIALSQDINIHNFGKYGDYSYGIYIYGFPIQQLVTFINGGSMKPITNMLIAYPIILVLAILSWHLIEKPCLALKDKPLLKSISSA